jgi:large subunit ribosomal protein L20
MPDDGGLRGALVTLGLPKSMRRLQVLALVEWSPKDGHRKTIPKNYMTRVKRGNVARKRRQKILKLAQGFRGSSSALFRPANQHALKGLQNASRDRHRRKREFRSLWVARINAAARSYGLRYNELVGSLRGANASINRKMLAQLACCDRQAFQELVAIGREQSGMANGL